MALPRHSITALSARPGAGSGKTCSEGWLGMGDRQPPRNPYVTGGNSSIDDQCRPRKLRCKKHTLEVTGLAGRNITGLRLRWRVCTALFKCVAEEPANLDAGSLDH